MRCPLWVISGHRALNRPFLFIPCGGAKFSDLSLTHINVQIVFLRWDLSKRVQEGSMQVCNATYDRQLDLLDCRASMLGFDLYAIESGDVFEELNRRCFNCSFQEACRVDLRRDPTSPVWESYCPNAAILGELAEVWSVTH
jgi:hypothetical protein